MQTPHKTVLKTETVEPFLAIKSGVVVDCTTGFGGHSEALLSMNPNILTVCIDRDIEALDFAKERLKPFGDRCSFIHGSFAKSFERLKELPIVGLIADLGVSSFQLDCKERGFGFESETLDMRMDTRAQLSALEVVNRYPLDRLEQIFKSFGEVREYKKCAKIVCDARKVKKIESAKELSELFLKHFKRGAIHPATLPFQAIRIEVNGELDEIEGLLKSVGKLSPKGAAISVISFHSLEDRVVKNYFREWEKSCICKPGLLRCECGNNHQKGRQLTKKPIIPSQKEINENQRSRSAKLRIFKFN